MNQSLQYSKAEKAKYSIFQSMTFKEYFRKRIKPNYIIYLLLVPALACIIVFNYWPMYGIQIAFKKYNVALGFFGSPWVGFEHFERFFGDYMFWRLLKNTLILSLYQFVVEMPVPIVLALCLHYSFNQRFKRISQTLTYAPHFISTVVIVGIMTVMLSPRYGIVNVLLDSLGFEKINFLVQPDYFRHLYVWSGVWQNAGFNSIIYMAVITNISIELHEAAIMDGASKFKRILHIDLPVLMPTFTVLNILALGRIMTLGFEKVYLMQNSANIMISEVISTYTYRLGIQGGEFSFTTAVGLFNNIINITLLLLANWISKRITNYGLM